MYYRINEVSTEVSSRHTYVHVDFWRDKAEFDARRSPLVVSDFLMSLRDDGSDTRTEIHDNIKRYWDTAQRLSITGDHTVDATKRLFKRGKVVPKAPRTYGRDNSDPHNVLTPAVRALEHTEHEDRSR